MASSSIERPIVEIRDLYKSFGDLVVLAGISFDVAKGEVIKSVKVGDRPRGIGVAFSCSQKTLPVALFLFQTYYQETFPLAVVPLLFYHVGQLILDTWIAEWLSRTGLQTVRTERTG